MTAALPLLFPGRDLPDVIVSGIALDSREVHPGDLFVALPGTVLDGRCFISKAIESGAQAIVSPTTVEVAQSNVPIIVVPEIQSSLGSIASNFYGEPSKQLEVAAVTGTNGKTSVTHFAASAMNYLSRRSGVIGTLGAGLIGDLDDVGLTTPDAVTFQKSLSRLARLGAEAAFVEASSHGLSQFRLDGTRIVAAVLTNLTRDHLDYHGNMLVYRQAKERLLDWPGLNVAVLNFDDPWTLELSRRPISAKVVTFSTRDSAADIAILNPVFDELGSRFTLKTPVGSVKVQSGLLGMYNLSNLAAVAALLYWYRFGLEDIGAALEHCQPPPGRLECVVRSDRTLWVDFAHTPDAVAQVLATMRQHFNGRLITVLGCGGDRDPGKRSAMGRIASDLSDICFFTSDNPRSEDPEKIIDAMCANLSVPMPAERCLVDRQAAIFAAVDAVGPRDVGIVLGKGHESYQEIGGIRHPFSDRSVIQQASSRREALL